MPAFDWVGSRHMTLIDRFIDEATPTAERPKSPSVSLLSVLPLEQVAIGNLNLALVFPGESVQKVSGHNVNSLTHSIILLVI